MFLRSLRNFESVSASQIAAVWAEGNDLEGKYARKIVVHGEREKNCQRENTIKSTHRVHPHYGCYNALQYLLLFPLGENGWHRNIPRSKGGRKVRGDQSFEVHSHVNEEDFEKLLFKEQGTAYFFLHFIVLKT